VAGQVVTCETAMVDAINDGPLAAAYQHLSWRIYGLCRHLLGSHEAAREAAQEVFLRVQQAQERFDQARPPENWLLSIARNHCLDQLRRRQTEQRLFAASAEQAPEPVSHEPSPLGTLLAKEKKAAFREALNKLPHASREALLLRYERELDYAAIGEALGMSRNQVGVLIFRAKEELRRILNPARKESAQ